VLHLVARPKVMRGTADSGVFVLKFKNLKKRLCSKKKKKRKGRFLYDFFSPLPITIYMKRKNVKRIRKSRPH
jgi:hypothetical protein